MLTFHGLVLSVVETALSFTGCSMSDRQVKRQSQVWSKEMSEMRANHCRGIVTNYNVVQNRRGRRPKEISRVHKAGRMKARRTTGVKVA